MMNNCRRLGLLTVALAFCLTAVACESTAPGYSKIRGELTEFLNAGVQDVYDASLEALKDAKITVRRNSVDEFSGKIEARTGDGKDVVIYIKRLDDQRSSWRIRVWPVGDEERSQYILDKVKKEL